MSDVAEQHEEVSVSVQRLNKYRFLVDFGADLPHAYADEPAPLGDGSAPSPVQWLAAAVANCLSASLVFANGRYREDAGEVHAKVTCRMGRNERGRLRVVALDAHLTMGSEPGNLEHLERALQNFEDFCTVSKSVEAGIPLRVSVMAPDGRILKAP